MEPSKHKIIRCSENEVEPEVLHSSVNKYTPHKNSTQQGKNQKILGGSWFWWCGSSILQHLWLLNIELEHTRHNLIFKQLESVPNNFSSGMLCHYLI